MEIKIPKTSKAFASLLRADLLTQWRNRRSFVLVLFVPVIILISWKDLIDKLGGAFALSACITIGLMAIGLMGYANSIAAFRVSKISGHVLLDTLDISRTNPLGHCPRSSLVQQSTYSPLSPGNLPAVAGV